MNQAYIDGVIDPEFYTIQSPDDYGMFYTAGTSAVLVSEGIISNLADLTSIWKLTWVSIL